MWRGCWRPVATSSRDTASSSRMVAQVSSTKACTDTRVKSVTSPSGPKARPTSGTPIMVVLLKVPASASTVPWRPNPRTAHTPTNTRAATQKYTAMGRKSSCATCTEAMVRNSSAGVSTMKVRLLRSGMALARIRPRRPQTKPTRMKRTTGASAVKTAWITAGALPKGCDFNPAIQGIPWVAVPPLPASRSWPAPRPAGCGPAAVPWDMPSWSGSKSRCRPACR